MFTLLNDKSFGIIYSKKLFFENFWYEFGISEFKKRFSFHSEYIKDGVK